MPRGREAADHRRIVTAEAQSLLCLGFSAPAAPSIVVPCAGWLALFNAEMYSFPISTLVCALSTTATDLPSSLSSNSRYAASRIGSLSDFVNENKPLTSSGRRCLYCALSSSMSLRGRPPGFSAAPPGNKVPFGRRAMGAFIPLIHHFYGLFASFIFQSGRHWRAEPSLRRSARSKTAVAGCGEATSMPET